MQRRESRGIERAAAEHAMATEQPQIPDLANRRSRRRFGQSIGRVVVLFRDVLERRDPQIDLAHLEADHLDIEIETV